MKNLHQFQEFNLPRFLDGKTLVVTGIKDLVDFETKAIIGSKVEVAITRDDTVYAPNKKGEIASNLYEKLDIKVKLPNAVNVAIGDEVIISDNAIASVYGDYGDKISITADGLSKVDRKTKN